VVVVVAVPPRGKILTVGAASAEAAAAAATTGTVNHTSTITIQEYGSIVQIFIVR